ncbi:MAG TPA: 30S ribosome-binding factor RbfA [Tenuifilaceae bacterium]|nr:30S ribosome-binding factor RbfA [Tenuifilaceae bacterium]HPE17432.1 30S ribosome-binding factor RbfA [Tenuifilaceae bacterium]HPJ45619.1 30S ribosome-binding factor RbfA [Tenuifilaceae bacterium]HPQ33489.1 30S ribosome-binding factor RbfA [Tenuifilaceae bacterium]HRX66978.1 30S ribosome-binding factor RbfA [Tenuifilaceae bacterium]
MESTRQIKVGRQIQKDLGEIFQRQSAGMFHGSMITVTKVRMSPDFSLAKAYVSIFPNDKRESVLETINQQAKSIRHELGKRVRNQLRIVPELAFFIDDSLDYIENIDRLLKE